MNNYEKFQEWLNNCPVEIINYLDYTDQFEVIFSVPIEEEKVWLCYHLLTHHSYQIGVKLTSLI